MNAPLPRTGICFDLDHCLYQYPPEMPNVWDQSFFKAINDLSIPLTYEEYLLESANGRRNIGNPVDYMSKKYNVDLMRLMTTIFSHMPESIIQPCPETARLLLINSTVPMIIVTDGPRGWAERVVPRLGLSLVFPPDRIVAIEDSNGKQKNNSGRPYEIAAERLGIPMDRLIMVDDHTKNLKTAHAGGKITVHITHGASMGLEDHVHHQVTKAIDVFDLIHQGQIPWDGPVVTPRRASPRLLSYSPGL